MFITELDGHGNCVRAEDDRRGRRFTYGDRRMSTASSSASSSADEASSYATAANSLQRLSSSGGSGLGISRNPSNRSRSRGDSRQRMASSSTITAAAAVQYQNSDAAASVNWPGGIMRQTDIRVESRELAGLDAELRRRSHQRLPRDGRWALAGEREALSELATFLRNVSPPPGNYMSLPDPTSPTTLSSVSSSIRRRASRKAKKRGPLRKALALFRRGSGSKTSRLSKKRSASQLAPECSPSSASNNKKVKRRRPPRIKLPDTAVAGTTVEGFRHIAISIPIEHAHLGPEPRYRYPSPNARRVRSFSSSAENGGAHSGARSGSPPRIYQDVNVRPMSAFVTAADAPALHVGTQLGPLVEERESLSSRSWERNSGGEEAAAARKVHLASRHTFGTVHEEQHIGGGGSRPSTAHEFPSPPRRGSDESSGALRTPRTSDELRAAAHKQALVTLAGGGGGSSVPLQQASSSSARPTSAYSFRSFATPSPAAKVQYPMRNSSLHPSGVERGGRARARSNSDRGGGSTQQQRRHSRDSSRDQTTLQESIFSERSYLESLDTVETGGVEHELQQPPTPGSVEVISEAKAARRFEGSEVVVHEWTPRRSVESKRTTDSSGGSASEKGRRRENHAQRPQRQFRLSDGVADGMRPDEERVVDEAMAEGPSRGLNPKADAKGKGKEIGEPYEERRPTTPVQGTHPRRKDEVERQDMAGQSLLVTPERRPRSKGKGKQMESLPPEVTEERSPSKTGAKVEREEKSPSSPIPSPKERREKRKSILLSRKQRFAELKKALDQPGTQPKDLLWERTMSLSSSSSEESTPRASRVAKLDSKRNSFPYPAGTTALSPTRPKTVPPSLSVTRVVTVADVQPSSPERMELVRKDSIPLSISSPATVSTVLKASPIPPFRSLGSVTPPESPQRHESPSPPESPADEHRMPPRHPHPTPLKRINSRGSRRSGRPSPTSPSTARRSPVLATREGSPSRPKTAGKGALASKKDLIGANPLAAATMPDLSTVASKESSAEAAAGTTPPRQKSVLKMSRSEIFERYEALREKQTRDMEKRLRRLERNGEQWLTSVLPLLSDLSQTLGRLAEGRQDDGQKDQGKGKEKEIERPKTSRAHENGRQSRFANRPADIEARRPRTVHGLADRERSDATPGLERDEPMLQRRSGTRGPGSGSGTGAARPYGKRLYLQDSPLLYPDLGYRVDTRSLTDDGRSLSLNAAGAFEGISRPRYRQARTTFVAPEAAAQQHRRHGYQQQHQQPQTSASTTMVGSTAGRANSLLQANLQQHKAKPQPLSPPHLPCDEDLQRVERLSERVSARMRSLSLEPPASPPKSFSGGRRQRRDSSSRDGNGGLWAPGVTRRFSEDSGSGSISSSLETYEDTTDRGERDVRAMVAGQRRGGGGNGGGGPEFYYVGNPGGSGMDTIEPLMRELQANGSRLSMESAGSLDMGDDEVRRMREGPGPRAVVGFGAFSM